MARILGIDYGRKRVGLAVSDDLEWSARPLRILGNTPNLLSKLEDICTEYNIKKIVLGMPHSEKYKDAENAVNHFALDLKGHMDIEVVFQDETNSSIYARTYLRTTGMSPQKIKEKLDMYAAQKILEDYLKRKDQ